MGFTGFPVPGGPQCSAKSVDSGPVILASAYIKLSYSWVLIYYIYSPCSTGSEWGGMDTGWATSSVSKFTFQASCHRKELMETLHKNEGAKEFQEMWNPIWEAGEGNSQIDGPK